jgi:D-alanyl-D-alanine carboxypeptidase
MASPVSHVRDQFVRCLLVAACLTSFAIVGSARAQIGSARYSSIVIDARSGDVLEQVNADQPRHPASLTKMMTLYLTFEALRDRRISLGQAVPVSAHAASMEPTKLGLVPGTHLTVEQGILGLVTKSANDAASALAELLGGSEDRFAQMMTLRARAMGMSHTTFTNASGLPSAEQVTTARDLAILSRRLINDFPGYYRYFSTPSFAWHRQVIFNHDNMLRTYPGADGLKTGYTDASGHNLATSAVRDGVRLVGIVLGAASNPERDIHMASLLDNGFEQMDVPVFRKPERVASRVSLISSAHAAEAPRPSPVRTRAAINREAAAPAPSRSHGANKWVVQVGAFPSQAAAHRAAMVAWRLTDAGVVHVEAIKVKGKTHWRAQVTGLNQADAKEICSVRHKGACIMIRPESGQLASR